MRENMEISSNTMGLIHSFYKFIRQFFYQKVYAYRKERTSTFNKQTKLLNTVSNTFYGETVTTKGNTFIDNKVLEKSRFSNYSRILFSNNLKQLVKYFGKV